MALLNFKPVELYKPKAVSPSLVAAPISSIETFVEPTITGDYIYQTPGTQLVPDRMLGAASIFEPIPQGEANSNPFIISANQVFDTEEFYGATLSNSMIEDKSQYVTLVQVSQVGNQYFSYDEVQQYYKSLGFATTSSTTETIAELDESSQTGESALTTQSKEFFGDFKLVKRYNGESLAVHENGLGPIIRYIHTKTTLLN